MLSIRWATVDDAAGVAAVHVNAWRVAYAGLIDQAVLDRQSVDARTEMWRNWITRSLAGEAPGGYGDVAHRLLIAELDGVIRGWASFGGGRDDDARELGELAGLYVEPTRWSRGVGNALIERAQQELAATGWTDAYLWVLDGNARAIRFYERHGWRATAPRSSVRAGASTACTSCDTCVRSERVSLSGCLWGMPQADALERGACDPPGSQRIRAPVIARS